MKAFGIVLALVAAQLSAAQVVTGINFTGGTSVTAQAYHLVPKIGYTGGSGRGGGGGRHPYTYYVTVIDQTQSASVPFSLGSPQSASAVCTWYTPSFSANATNSAIYSESGTMATLAFGLNETTDPLPTTTGYNRVSSGVSSTAKVFFSVPKSTTVQITLGGSLSSLTSYTIGTTSTDGDPVIAYVSPGVYTLAGGFGYYVTVSPVSLAGLVGSSQSGDLAVQLNFTAASGEGGGDGGGDN